MSNLYFLVGLPGSGKSNYSLKLPNTKVMSSDTIREELYGDEAIQGDNAKIFQIMANRTRAALAAGFDTIYDATNLNRKRRIGFLKCVDSWHLDVTKICVMFVTPYAICCERNATRDRVVPQEVMDRMLHRYDIPLYEEGWDMIFIEGQEPRKSIKDIYIDYCDYSQDNSYHKLTLGEHCYAAAKFAMEDNHNYNDMIVAAYLHDCGKPFCKVFHDAKGNSTVEAHYYDHDKVGSYFAFEYYEYTYLAAILIALHMKPYGEWKTKVNPIYKAYYDDVMLLHKYDKMAH